MHDPFSKMLKLNVGGQWFLASLETLKKDPGNFKSRCLTKIIKALSVRTSFSKYFIRS